MPVALYNLKPPQVQAIQLANDPTTLQTVLAFLNDPSITTLAQLRAALGPNDLGQLVSFGDWLVHEVGDRAGSFRVLSNATFTSQYVLAP